jgi:hypothetical protein
MEVSMSIVDQAYKYLDKPEDPLTAMNDNYDDRYVKAQCERRKAWSAIKMFVSERVMPFVRSLW